MLTCIKKHSHLPNWYLLENGTFLSKKYVQTSDFISAGMCDCFQFWPRINTDSSAMPFWHRHGKVWVFVNGLKSNDLQSVYLAINHKTANETEKKDVCKRLVALHLHSESKLNEFERNFYLFGTHKHLGCMEKYPNEVDDSIKNASSKNSSTT